MATPYDAIILDEVESTQDVAAAELRSSSLPVLIVASRQTGGRGRSGTEWWQAPRGVATSLAFRNEDLAVADAFTLTVGLAVRTAITRVAGIEVLLKWPNDIEVAGSKVGGILVERTGRHTVVGCGINLWWPEPPPGVAGLFDDAPGPEVGEALSREWAENLLSGRVVWDRERYVAACSTLGSQVTWDPAGSGRAVDVDSSGGLVVATDEGTVTIRSGSVRSVRRTG